MDTLPVLRLLTACARASKTRNELDGYVQCAADVLDAVRDYDPNQPRDPDGKFGSGGTTSPEERQKKIDSVKIDFNADNTLPELNDEDLAELGKESKPVVFKKETIERNLREHPEVPKEDYNRILGQALYNSDTRFGGKAYHNQNYVNFAKFGDKYADLALVELAEQKECYEIVHVMNPRNTKVEKMKQKK
jgi:hypothetical protein